MGAGADAGPTNGTYMKYDQILLPVLGRCVRQDRRRARQPDWLRKRWRALLCHALQLFVAPRKRRSRGNGPVGSEGESERHEPAPHRAAVHGQRLRERADDQSGALRAVAQSGGRARERQPGRGPSGESDRHDRRGRATTSTRCSELRPTGSTGRTRVRRARARARCSCTSPSTCRSVRRASAGTPSTATSTSTARVERDDVPERVRPGRADGPGAHPRVHDLGPRVVRPRPAAALDVHPEELRRPAHRLRRRRRHCGNLIPGGCGSCPMGQTCGAGGMPGVCSGRTTPPGSCVSRDVRPDQRITCGAAGDGCGNAISGAAGSAPRPAPAAAGEWAANAAPPKAAFRALASSSLRLRRRG